MKLKNSDYLTIISSAIEKFYEESGQETFDCVANSILQALKNDIKFYFPIGSEQIDDNGDETYEIMSITADDEVLLAAFTSEDAAKETTDKWRYLPLEPVLETTLFNDNISGVVINPFERNFILHKKLIKEILESVCIDLHDRSLDIIKGDITTLKVEAIVNAANKSLMGGGGVDGAIHGTAGAGLDSACSELGGCECGEAKITDGFMLPANYIIHTVGPVYSSKNSKECAKLLKRCYFNSLELARENNIHSIAFPAISAGVYGYPHREAAEIAIETIEEWCVINEGYNIKIILVCFDDEMEELYKEIYEEHGGDKIKIEINFGENKSRVQEALEFAVNAHKTQTRKGSNVPYAYHLIEAAQTLHKIGADPNLEIAGLLHDTLEDTDTKLIDIYERFGFDVAALVMSHTEDKEHSWFSRKSAALQKLKSASDRKKLLVMADATSNLRSMYADVKLIGDSLWSRFNAPKERIAWYYDELDNIMKPFADNKNISALYWEMLGLIKDLFVHFYMNYEEDTIYQIWESGEIAMFKRETAEWTDGDTLSADDMPDLDDLHEIGRLYAERIEDNWRDALTAKKNF